MKTGKNLSRLVMLLSVTMFTMWIGCSDKSATSLTADEASIQDEIIDDADEILGIDMMEDDNGSNIGKENPASLSKGAVPIDTVKGYGRRVKITRENIVVTVAPDTLSAEALVTFKMAGRFVVLAKNAADSGVTVVLKPMVHTIQRVVKFVRNLNPESDRRWLVDEVSAAYGISKDGTLSLGNVSIDISGSNNQHYEFSDPLGFFVERDNLPRISQGDTVRITVGVTNSVSEDKPHGFLHRGRGARPNRVRIDRKERFNDDGVNGDVTANDGIYTARWIVSNGDFAGVHIGNIDFLTHGALYETDAVVGPYNSLLLSIPYIKDINLGSRD